MVATVFMTAFGILLLLLIGAVYCALVISHKTDEMIRNMSDEPARVSLRQKPVGHGRSILGSA